MRIEWYWSIQANFHCSGHRTTSKKNLLEPLLKKRQEINLCNEAKTWRKRAEVFMAQWGPPIWILRLTTNRFLALTKKCYHWCWLNYLEMHYLRWTTTPYYNQGEGLRFGIAFLPLISKKIWSHDSRTTSSLAVPHPSTVVAKLYQLLNRNWSIQSGRYLEQDKALAYQ